MFKYAQSRTELQMMLLGTTFFTQHLGPFTPTPKIGGRDMIFHANENVAEYLQNTAI